MKGSVKSYNKKVYTKNYQFTFVENGSEGYYIPERMTIFRKIKKSFKNTFYKVSRRKYFDLILVPIITSVSVFLIFLIFLIFSKLSQ